MKDVENNYCFFINKYPNLFAMILNNLSILHWILYFNVMFASLLLVSRQAPKARCLQ